MDSKSGLSGGWYKATIGKRWLAVFVDGLILFVVQIILSLVLTGIIGKSLVPVINILVYLLYNVLFIYKSGATLGKKWMKIKVVSTTGKPLTLIQAILRETVGKLISGLVFSLGYIWAFWDKNRQTWHDKIAGTYVVTQVPNDGKNSKILIVLAVLLVIAVPVIAIISAIAVIAINPLELTRRSRDAVRITDLSRLEVVVKQEVDSKTNLCGSASTPCTGMSNAADDQKINGEGWIKADLSSIAATNNLLQLPIDPVNSNLYFYKYCSDGKDFEIDTYLESQQQKKQRSADQTTGVYKVGSNTNLCK